jgi:phospholipase C
MGETALPSAPPAREPPRQHPGTRPSRALPYVLDVVDRVDAEGIALSFSNAGQVAAVFHVYDKNRLDLVPRRYTVEPGKALVGHWATREAYDLWVLGPNGFHRQYAGRRGKQAVSVTASYLAEASELVLTLSNPYAQPLTIVAADAAYGAQVAVVELAPGEQSTHSWDTAASGNWYDISLHINEVPAYLRRFAGRLENGKDSISDPAMGKSTG